MQRIVWSALSPKEQRAALARSPLTHQLALVESVSQIIERVAKDGDLALRQMALEFDNTTLDKLQLDQNDITRCCASVPLALKKAIDDAAINIHTFHSAQKQAPISIETCSGVHCELRTEPIDRVGLYIPSGSAPLISTVLMLAIPAQIAGCSHKVLITPPSINDAIVYAAHSCGIDKIYLSGGAQAIAALALGTQTIDSVDKIFGPGNTWVTEAKRQLSQDSRARISIDMPAGPSEVLVIADRFANPEFVAADLLSQAEHGADSQVILVTDSSAFAEKVEKALTEQLTHLPRANIAYQALEYSRIIEVNTLDIAATVSNLYSPEHLIVQTQNPRKLLPLLKGAGSIFLGAWTPESVGDYASGTNHVLPTYGYASSISSLSLADFSRRYTVQALTRQGLERIGDTVMTLADAEQLEAHKNAVKLRLNEPDTLQEPNTHQASNLAKRLARPELLDLQPYQSARRIGGQGNIWVNANESPFNNTSLASINRYPECQPFELIKAYADYIGLPANSLVCSRGADEAIELLIRTFCIPNQDAIVTFSPTYGMYEISAKTCNVRVTQLKLDENYQLPNSDELAKQIKNEKIIFVCNPNNPTGTLVPKQQIIDLLTQFPEKLIVVDEAYIEFCPEHSLTALVNNYANLVVLRTLSKAFALAGIRCGFMLANFTICELVMRVIAPYPVPVPVATFAIEALSRQRIALMQSQVASLIANGKRLTRALQQRQVKVYPSVANFLLAEFTDVKTDVKTEVGTEAGTEVEKVALALTEAGIVARRYNHPRLARAIRLSFTNESETDAIIQALENTRD